MVIENASPALAAFVKRTIVAEMATFLHAGRINLDDDGAIVTALYRGSYSSCAIANLMDDARTAARNAAKSAAATIAFTVSIVFATSFGTLIASDAIGPTVIEIMEARTPDIRPHAARIPA